MVSAPQAPQVAMVDGEGQIAGRLSSHIAKLLLTGSRIYVVNAEKVLVSGRVDSTLEEMLKKLKISSVVHPKHGPFHPRTPDRILTRMIRGMIPRRKPKGVDAMRRLRVYVGVPLHCKSIPKINFDDIKASKPKSYYVPLSEIASSIGWRRV